MTLKNNVGDCLDKPDRLINAARLNALSHGHELAWVDNVAQEKFTHQDILEKTFIAIERLRSRNLEPGQVVCLILTRTGNFLPLLMACIELDLVLAPVAEDRNDIQASIRGLRARLVLYGDGFSLEPESISSKVEVLSISAFMSETCSGAKQDLQNYVPYHELKEIPALLIQTSGTSGQPKYVELSEKNLAWDGFSLQSRYRCSWEDRLLCTLPWSHMNAIMLTGCLPLIAGATTVYSNITRSSDPVAAILAEKVSIVSLTPTLISFLIKRNNSGLDLSTLKFAFCGAAPLNSDLWREGEKLLKCKIYQGYGLTETTCWVASSVPGQVNDYVGAGNPLAGEINIDTTGDFELITQTSPLGNGSQKLGEIQIRGPLLMCGYRLQNGKRNSRLTDAGYFKTGDIGYFDQNNNICIVGRIKEVIIRSGINVIPESIDAVLRKHPAIAESKTVGVEDPLLGERIVTAYVLKEGASLKDIELRRFAAGKLSGKFLPNEYVHVSHLPSTAVGKVAIEELRRLVRGDYARDAFESINTWKYKRAHPQEPDRIIQIFQKKILMSRPLEFITYWGAGLKTSASDSDRQAMQRLREFVDAPAAHSRLQAKLKLILTDTHALLNGKPRERIESYFKDVQALCQKYGFSYVRSSELWQKAGLSMADVLHQAESVDLPGVIDVLGLSPDLVNRLVNSATRHVEVGGTDDGLKRYLLACQAERAMMADEYDGSIFLTYNDPEMRFLSPPLPSISISSYNRGTAIKPWFADH
ncbi:class I adenylate-forming enzyme family protein [Paraburkholderia hayleyella]|uniref:class I adenylate-forming enzyme family protein n=1 Tax=Paraburkholderia hayleyella TaxID=2152889 RepID=UPI001580F13A|nr:fatty acid--CoA ligase family protein [Paraburkholderia hayleyella]